MQFKAVNVYAAPGLDFSAGEALVRKEGSQTVLHFCRTEEEIVSAALDADAIIGAFSNGIQTLSRKTIELLPQLKQIAVIGTGYDGVDLESATANGICVSNVPDYCLEEMADHTILLLLALAKKLKPTIDAVRAGMWDAAVPNTIRAQVLPPLFRVSGQTLGLIGFGNVARTVVPRAKAFGLRIIAYSPHLNHAMAKSMGVEPVSLVQLLRESDYVSLHAALNEGNRHMLGLEQLRMMKPTAFLINTARGGLVDEQALYRALTGGIIAGAGLDAMEPEPPARDNPLLRVPNVIITPHMGSYSEGSLAYTFQQPYREVVSVMKGAWPRDNSFLNPEVKARFMAKWAR